jgi:hypothetical protein
MHQQLWGYKVEWKSVSRGTGGKRLNTTGIDCIYTANCSVNKANILLILVRSQILQVVKRLDKERTAGLLFMAGIGHLCPSLCPDRMTRQVTD